MDPLGEGEFRSLLDERGVLLPGRLAAPARSSSYAVFAQRADAGLDVPRLKAQATRFFDVKVGLTSDKRYGETPPTTDAARFVVSSDLASGTRLCFGRPVEADDFAAVDLADRGDGLALLARRCETVWLVAREEPGDRVALVISTILASVFLGPILSPEGELFGVRTARDKLAR